MGGSVSMIDGHIDEVLKPCPFCGGEAFMRLGEFPPKSCEQKKLIPKGARLIRTSTYPSGRTFYEYRQKAYIPQCLDSKCMGRTHRLFETKEEAEAAWNRRADTRSDLSSALCWAAGLACACSACCRWRGRTRMAKTFESRVDGCEWCINLWGIHYCRLAGEPCVRLEECPKGRGADE